MSETLAAERAFVERLLDKAGIKPANDELRGGMINELVGRLQQHCILNLADALPAEKFVDFERFMESDPEPRAIIDFLTAQVPAGASIISQSEQQFADAFLASAHA